MTYFKYHKGWLKNKKEKGELDSYDKYSGIVKDWAIIVISAIMAVIFLVKYLIG